MAERVLRWIALLYLGVLVALPVSLVFWRTIRAGVGAFADTLTAPDTVHALRLTVLVAGSAVLLNTVFGVGLAVLLARRRLPGRRLVEALVDAPISVSPVVVGLALVLVYGASTGWFGTALAGAGIQVIYAPLGMVLATVFVSLPLVLRAVLPVLEAAGDDQEQAARSLGANAVQRFRRITIPTLRWAVLYGVVLSVARCLGEFGAVRVVSGDVTGRTQTLTLVVDQRAEQFQPGAYQLSVLLIGACALCIVAVSVMSARANGSLRAGVRTRVTRVQANDPAGVAQG